MTRSAPDPLADLVAMAIATLRHGPYGSTSPTLAAAVEDLQRQLAEAVRKMRGYQSECDEVEQTLGKALGYPWFKDDQKNFPDASEADGVCVGEHSAGTIASEAATRLAEADATIARDTSVNYAAMQERTHAAIARHEARKRC